MSILHDRPIVSTVADAYRIAIGTPSDLTQNITFANIKNQLNAQLSFLRAANNLSELSNKATARANLSVPSLAEHNTKASITYVNDQDNAILTAVNALGARFTYYDVNVPQASWSVVGNNATATIGVNLTPFVNMPYVAQIMKRFNCEFPISFSLEFEAIYNITIRAIAHNTATPIENIYGMPVADGDLNFRILIISFG